MGEGQTWGRDTVITPVSEVISVEHYGEAEIKQEITRLRSLPAGRADQQLAEAANAWLHAREKFEEVQDVLRGAGERLAQAWSSRVSVHSQRALMLMHDSAGDLASTAHQMSDYTGTSAQLMRQMLDAAPSDDDPGPAESFAGDVGAAYGHASPLGLLPGVESSTLSDLGRSVYEKPGAVVDSVAGALGFGNDRTAEYQAALERLNQGYVAENWRMPARVTAELPLLGDGSVPDTRRDRLPTGPATTAAASTPGMVVAPTSGDPGSAPGSPGIVPGADMRVAPSGGQGGELDSGDMAPDQPSTVTPPVGLVGTGDYLGAGDGGLAGTGSGPGTGLPGTGGPDPGAGPGAPRIPGIGAGTSVGTGTAPAGTGATVGGAGGAGPGIGGGALPVGAGGTRGDNKRGSGGHPGVKGAVSGTAGSSRVPAGRAGVGGMVPMGAGGAAGEEDGSSQSTWLVEDDSPFTVEEVEDLPGVIR